MKDVNKEPWFHGRITREEAEDVLDRGGCADGQFLVRESTNLAGEYALSLCFRGNKYHYHITRHGDGRVAIEDGQRFEGPVELVAHHYQTQDGLLTRLKKALHRAPGIPPRGYRGVSHEEMQAARMNAVANFGFPGEVHEVIAKFRRQVEQMVGAAMHAKQSWFHGNISRDEAEKRMRGRALVDGLFLVRERDTSGSYSMCLAHRGQLYHYLLDVDTEQLLSIQDGRKFDTLLSVVDHYSRKADGLLCRLTDFVPVEQYRRLPGAHPPSRPPGQADLKMAPRSTPQRPVMPRPLPPPAPHDDTYDQVKTHEGADKVSSLVKRAPPPLTASRDGGLPDFFNVESEPGYRSLFDDCPSEKNFNIPRSHIVTEDKLGSGNFGSVLLGKYKLMRSGHTVPVALKTLKTEEVPNQKSEILREAETMAGLDHPHIVRLVGIVQSTPMMLVMELARLGPLNKFVKKRNLSLMEVLRLMLQVCIGMAYLESKRFVHRDLAARNVLCVTEKFCKISDFGMSRALGLGSEYYKTEVAGKWPLKWYAPECIYYFKFDSKSDVWSFGVTMWEALSAGEKPYTGKKGTEILKMLELGERLEPPSVCPPEVYTVMKKCWDFEPANRPTFSQLLEDMKDVCRRVHTGEILPPDPYLPVRH